jgi:hypothetical protein
MARGLASRTLDLDDARAGIGKANGAEGRRHGLLNRNDQQPRERAAAGIVARVRHSAELQTAR